MCICPESIANHRHSELPSQPLSPGPPHRQVSSGGPNRGKNSEAGGGFGLMSVCFGGCYGRSSTAKASEGHCLMDLLLFQADSIEGCHGCRATCTANTCHNINTIEHFGVLHGLQRWWEALPVSTMYVKGTGRVEKASRDWLRLSKSIFQSWIFSLYNIWYRYRAFVFSDIYMHSKLHVEMLLYYPFLVPLPN